MREGWPGEIGDGPRGRGWSRWGGAGPEGAWLALEVGLEQMGHGWPREEGMDGGGVTGPEREGLAQRAWGSRAGLGSRALSNVGPKEVNRDQSFMH